MKELSHDQLVQETHEFMQSDYGKHVILRFGEQYNKLHQDAESVDSNEKMASLIHEAKGWKAAMSWFMGFETSFQQQQKANGEAKDKEQA